MGYAKDTNKDEFIVVGECTGSIAEKEGVGDGHIAPIGTDKVSYTNVFFISNGLDGDVTKILGFIDKDVVTMQEDIIFGSIWVIHLNFRIEFLIKLIIICTMHS
ncbi:hypothetical protein GQ457_09G000230 [Hibiscus cannabinus]